MDSVVVELTKIMTSNNDRVALLQSFSPRHSLTNGDDLFFECPSGPYNCLHKRLGLVEVETFTSTSALEELRTLVQFDSKTRQHAPHITLLSMCGNFREGNTHRC
jgi:hypothetical protein